MAAQPTGPSQNVDNHKRFDPLYHPLLMPGSFVVFILVLVYLFTSFSAGENRLLSVILLLFSLCLLVVVMKLRLYALCLQDRIIRTELQLRYYMLTGGTLPGSLTLKQIIALRFASDEELAGLAARAAEEGLAPAQIKKAIRSWQPDHLRV
ncbi:DUF6526 family protein [Paenibacillus sp. y28]|uniref:DUF6526 family protein n=1 Tax=Paenibacillus sp. y28 TaxID=3129110 RepID=UPI00301AF1C0